MDVEIWHYWWYGHSERIRMGIKPITMTAFGNRFDTAPAMQKFLDTVGVHVDVN